MWNMLSLSKKEEKDKKMSQSISWKMKAVSAMVLTALLSACGSGGSAGLDTSLPNSSGSQNLGNGNNHANTNHSESNTNAQTTTSDNWTFKQLSDADLKAATGEGVYVGIVDTGIRREARGLVNRNKNIAKKVIDENGKKLVDTFAIGDHGTIMTEVILDVAPDAAINSGTSNYNNGITTDVKVNAYSGLRNLLVAMQSGAKVDILNNSYGAYVNSDDWKKEYGNRYEKLKFDSMITDVYIPFFKIFIDKGTLVVILTHNNDKKTMSKDAALPLIAPELEKGFLAVTAYNRRTNKKTQNACGEITKNWCITAPEDWTAYGHNNTKELVFGTSTATAYVSGLAAKIKSRYDWFTNVDLKNTLITTADDMGEKGVDAVWGNGLVNADRAVKGYGRFDKDITLNVNGIKRAYFFDNDISGSGGVIKKGRDALVVSGNNTYTGNTTIAEGEWVANGNSKSHHIVKKGAILTIGDKKSTIELKSLNNQGTLSVNLSNLKINGDLNNKNGTVKQAIGTKIDVSGSANLTNASWVLTGIKKGYVTKAGKTEILLNAKNISGKDSFHFSVANTNLGELISQKYDLSDTQLSVTTTRKSVGDVVRDKANFVGKDKTVIALDGLLDRLDETKFEENYQKVHSAWLKARYNTSSSSPTTTVPGSTVASALLSSSNINKTVFEMNTQTAQHAQESVINQKTMRTDDLLTHTLQASDKGNVWTNAGYGKIKSDLANINGQSKDNSQTIGATYRLGQHSLGIQLSHLSYQWSEEFSGSLKKINTDGAGIETAYTFQHGNYWLSALAGVDFLKAKTSFGSDRANQYLFGLSAGKNFALLDGRLNLMPSVGLKYAQINGLDYRLQKYNSEYVSADNVKTRETSLSTSLDGAYRLGEKGDWLLMAGVKLRQILDGKTTYTANYGGYLVNISDTHRRGKRPDLIMNVGMGYRISDNVNVYLSSSYENGKYHNKRTINAGVNMSF